MRTTPLARPALVALTLALVAVLAACGSSSKEDGTTAGTPYTTVPPTTATTAPKVVRQTCNADNLTAAAVATYGEGTTITDRACSSLWAVATIESRALPKGIGVGFFQNGDDGAWVVVKAVPLTADLASEAPAGLPSQLLGSWRAAYDQRQSAATSTTAEDKEHPVPTEPEPEPPPPPPECPPDTPPESCPPAAAPAA